MDDFLTVYKIEYTPKSVKIRDRNQFKTPMEYTNPMTESFKQRLDIDESKPEECIEEIDAYFEKAKEKYPCVCKRFPFEKPVEKEVIKRLQLFEGRTTYQIDFCDVDEELEHKDWLVKNAVTLPTDIVIPLTTQKSSYRLPKLINTRAYEKDPVPKPHHNLKPNYKVRKILKVTTGISDYMSRIGNLGQEIIETELHGPVRHQFRRTDENASVNYFRV